MIPPRFRAGSDFWRTPSSLVPRIRTSLGGAIRLDPCTEESNPIGADSFIHPPIDGLTLPWEDQTWCNPPFSQTGVWGRKAILESRRCMVSGIVDCIGNYGPAHGGVNYGHLRCRCPRIGLILSVSRSETEDVQSLLGQATYVQFVKGKLKFSDSDRGAMLASWIFWFGPVRPDPEIGAIR